jgi:hypothetical protein
MTTGIPYSQIKTFLSSLEEANLRPLSTKVILLIEDKCSSYYKVLLPDRTSNYAIFLLALPTKKLCYYSGLNIAQNGIFLIPKFLTT